jgi:hypothetical protein
MSGFVRKGAIEQRSRFGGRRTPTGLGRFPEDAFEYENPQGQDEAVLEMVDGWALQVPVLYVGEAWRFKIDGDNLVLENTADAGSTWDTIATFRP